MSPAEQSPTAPRAPRRVLVVEDEKNQRELLLRVITEMEFQVNAVASAEGALDHLDQIGPTVMVLDLNLPGLNGLELAEQVYTRRPHTRMIVLTGYGDLDTARRAMKFDVVDFLLKPCPVGELEAAVARAYQKGDDALRAASTPAPTTHHEPAAPPADDQTPTLDHLERQAINAALARHEGNRTAAAKDLGISVRTLYYRLSRYEAEDSHRHLSDRP